MLYIHIVSNGLVSNLHMCRAKFSYLTDKINSLISPINFSNEVLVLAYILSQQYTFFSLEDIGAGSRGQGGSYRPGII